MSLIISQRPPPNYARVECVLYSDVIEAPQAELARCGSWRAGNSLARLIRDLQAEK